MQLVLMAAGHGTRFGGLKQLAPIGPKGEALMDYTAEDAVAAGFDHVVLVVREEVRQPLLDHIVTYWPPELRVTPVTQGPVAGTAQAVASTESQVEGSFGVVNADDLYGGEAMRQLASAIEGLGPDEHLIVGYRLDHTVLTDAPVTRGVCITTPEGYLVVLREETVARKPSGEGFTGRTIGAPADQPPDELTGEEVVSMNLWGFSEGIYDDLNRAIDRFDPATAPHAEGKPPELLLPDVVGHLVATDLARVRVVQTSGRCVGLTHPADVPLVRKIVAAERLGR
ncbi:MAG TPA: NTP transferase domain-containing protein [Acidimicrobiales bacterium]|nr:NTP transferase domain-containing protein [Acidimicrobiales bacterium]